MDKPYKNKPVKELHLVILFATLLLCLILGILEIRRIDTQSLILLILVIGAGFLIGLILWSQRSKYFREMHESEDRFRKVFDESPFCMIMTDKSLRFTRANKSFCRMTGYSEDEIKEFTFRKITHPDHIHADESAMQSLAANEIPIYRTEKKYIRKDGNIIWCSTTIIALRNDKGELQSFFGMIEEITPRKEAEAALESSLSLLKATIESTADGLLVVNSDSKVVMYNKKFTRMWGIPEEIILRGIDAELLDYVKSQLRNPEEFLRIVRQLYNDPDGITSDLLEFADGRYFERYSQPQIINGKSIGRVWSFRDITIMKKAEAALIAAKEKAEESDRLKTAFLHNVSHEIRTPMNAIIGFSTLLNENGISDGERIQYAGIISQSSTQLLSIINDIVDIANIESGQVKTNLSEININEAMHNLNVQFGYGKDNVMIRLARELPADRCRIVTDGTKVVQVLSNLISNALKFTSEGWIDFGCSIINNELEFFVRDTGIGISDEHKQKIFERFYQVDGAGTRQYGGTGLGLSICKAYSEMLGGRIWVESESGAGSVFRFTVPLITGHQS